MKKQILLIVIILLGLTNCKKVKNNKDIKVEAVAFKQKLINVKGFSKTFLELFGISEQKQLKSLTVGEPLPILLFDSENFNENDFSNNLEVRLASYYIVPYMIESKIVSWAYFSSTGGDTPSIIIPADCSVLKNGGTASINGGNVPVGLDHNKVYLDWVYTDMSEFDIGIYKNNGEFYGISLRDSFVSKKDGTYALMKGYGYSLQTIQQILKKNASNKE
jgi:hypothetical protein